MGNDCDCSITGTALTAGSAGFQLYQWLAGTGVTANTRIVGGSDPYWIVNISWPVASGTTIAGAFTLPSGGFALNSTAELANFKEYWAIENTGKVR